MTSARPPKRRPDPKLTALEPQARRRLGLAKGQIVIGDDFDDPLPEEIQRAFEGLDD